jgi:acetyl esterase
MTYRFDPDLAPIVPLLPVPGPASPTSGVAEAVAARGGMGAFMETMFPDGQDFEGVDIEDLAIAGTNGAPDVPIRLYRPQVRPAGPMAAILSIHGGGFAAGSIYEDITGIGRLARALGVVVVDVEYRLAPEHPAPAAVEDCYAVLRWLHDSADQVGVDPLRVMVNGGSAGGGIAAGLALYARDHAGPPICFQFLTIPELDDRLETPSMLRFGDTPMWNHHAAEQSWRWYLGGATGDDVSPYASPARATDLTGLPPAYISVMEFDPLRDEGIRYAQRLLEAGVTAELHVFPGTFHGSSLVTTAAISRREWEERLTVTRRALGLD